MKRIFLTVTFTEGLAAGDYVEIRWGTAEFLASTDAVNVTYTAPGVGSVQRTQAVKNEEHISIMDYVTAGATNHTAAFKAALAYANSVNRTLYANRDDHFKLTGSDTIVVSTSCDFRGATFDVSEFYGSIRIRNTAGFVDYVAGSAVFNAIDNTGILNSAIVTGWNGLAEVEDSFVILESDDQPYYSYRGDVINRKDYNRVSRFGRLYSVFKELDTSKLTKIRVISMPEKPLTFEGCTFDVGANDNSHQMLMVEQSALVTVKNIRFIMDDTLLVVEHPSYLWVMNSCQVECSDIMFERVIANVDPSQYGYLIQFNDNYDLTFRRVKGVGEGWGAVGGNDTCILKYIECELSRIDAHRPIRESMLVDKCKLGSSGINHSIIGDTYISNTTFTFVDADYAGNDGFIKSRVDLGCLLNGNLYINNCIFNSDVDTALIRAPISQSNPVPIGSPLFNRLFNFIEVVGCKTSFDSGSKVELSPFTETGYNPIQYPYELVYRDLDGLWGFNRIISSFTPQFAISDATITEKYNLKLTFDNVKFDSTVQFSVIDKTANHFKVDLLLSNCSGTQEVDGRVSVETWFNGIVRITASSISYIDLINTTHVTKPLQVSIDGCDYSNTGSLLTFQGNSGATTKARVTIANSKICGTQASLQQLALCRLSGNTYTSETVADTLLLALTAPLSATSGTLVMPVGAEDRTNEYALEVDGQLYRVMSHRATGTVLLNIGATVITLTRTVGSPNIFVTQTGTAVIGAIYLM